MTTFDRNSKPDTRGLFLTGALDVDVSQWRQDLTDVTTYMTSTDTRLAVRSPREISVVVGVAGGDSGVLVNWGNGVGTTYIYRITVTSGAVATVKFGHNNAYFTQELEFPGGLGGVAADFLIHWSTDYDHFANGWYSELAVCKISTGAWTHARVTHTEPQAPAVGEQFNLSGVGAGGSLFSGGLARYESVRVSCRLHSTTEASEDWVAESSAPSVTGIQPSTELLPVSMLDYSDGVGDPVNLALLSSYGGGAYPSYAGPAELLAITSSDVGRRRLWSPLVNQAIFDPPTLQDTYLPAHWHRTLPSLDDHQICLGLLWVRPVPPEATHARVRVFMQTWITVGSPMGTAVDFEVRVYSAKERWTSLNDPPTAATATVSSVTDHGSGGLGEWFDLGKVKLQTSKDGLTYLALAYLFGTGTGASYLRAKIKHVTIEPYQE